VGNENKMRLDTLLLNTRDVVSSVVEENLSAAEFVRLSICCKGMKVLLTFTPGLLYLPMLKTLPYITGLSIGRDSAYYLSILQTYFSTPVSDIPNTTARLNFVLGHHFPFLANSVDTTIKEIFRLCRTVCFSAAGRNLILECVDRCRRQYACMMDGHARNAMERIVFIVNHAFCVQRRRLQPGKRWRKNFVRTVVVVEHDYDGESDTGI
jgi:hypothetical protein